MKLNRYVALSALLCVSIANAKSITEVKLVAAEKAIKNVDTAMKFVAKNSDIPVVFPKQVPKANKTKLFAVTGGVGEPADYKKHWWINATTSPTCETHDCIVGAVDAEKNGKLELNYEATVNEKMQSMPKEKIELANKMIAYYTPAHAEADWHFASIEWMDRGVLYQMSWEMKGDSKKALTAMANSAISR